MERAFSHERDREEARIGMIERADPAHHGGPEVSVVVPLYNERETLPALHRGVTDALEGAGVSYEIVLVNDGSVDETPALLDEIAAHHPQTVAVHLSRNFGHQPAVCAGLSQARGRAVIVMDGDLQDPPEVLPQFIAMWRQGFDVVYAVRQNRKEGLLRRTAYKAFYRILRSVSDVPIPLDSGDFCLMDQKVVSALEALPEKHRFVRGLRAFVGFRQIGLAYDRPARLAGESKYTLRQLSRLALDGLIGFSSFPLAFVTYLGFGAAAASVALIAWVLWQNIVNHVGPQGWASTIAVVLLTSAVQLLSLGIIGEYIQRIFREVKGRPTFLIERVNRAETSERSPRRSRRSSAVAKPR